MDENERRRANVAGAFGGLRKTEEEPVADESSARRALAQRMAEQGKAADETPYKNAGDFFRKRQAGQSGE